MTDRAPPPLGAFKRRDLAAHQPKGLRRGRRSGELGGGNRIGRRLFSRSWRAELLRRAHASARAHLYGNAQCRPLSWGCPALRRRFRIVTWLILPVVICLSQRLSHACLSIASIPWNCEWLIKSVIVYLIVPYYLDTRGNSRANTC